MNKGVFIMGFELGTFSAVFSAQLLALFIAWWWNRNIVPLLDRAHDKVKEVGGKFIKKDSYYGGPYL